MNILVVAEGFTRASHLRHVIKACGNDLEVAESSSISTDAQLIVIDSVTIEKLAAIESVTRKSDVIVISNDQSSAFLMKAMRVGVREVAFDDKTLQEAVQRAVEKLSPIEEKTGEVYTFMSCKGGNGTSFLAANFAHVLSQRPGKNACLIGLNLQFGDSLMMLSDAKAVNDIADIAKNFSRFDSDLLKSTLVSVSESLFVLSSLIELSHALEVKTHHVEAIIKQARKMFDYVIIDAGSAIDSISTVALDESTKVFPVIQLTLPQLRDAKRLLSVFKSESLDYSGGKIQWVINRYQKGEELTAEAFEQTIGTKPFCVPNNFAGANASINQGVPLTELNKNSGIARALIELAREVSPTAEAKRVTWIAGLFR